MKMQVLRIDWKQRKTACEAVANIFKLINDGPTFRVTLPTNPHTVNLPSQKIRYIKKTNNKLSISVKE